MTLFVYGSLMRGEPAQRLLRGAVALGAASTAASYRLVDLGSFPGMAEGGQTAVAGELYEVDEARMVVLDGFEGSDYRRATVRLADGRVVSAYLLRVVPEGAPEIRSGDWRRR